MKYRAFVVDDYEQVRAFIAEALQARDFEVRAFSEAETTLAAFDAASLSEQPDLVVIDLQLEPAKMRGIDLVAELAERDISSEILVMSGVLGNDEMSRAIMAGAGAALPKPFDDYRVAIKKMEYLAETGKRRRLHKLTGVVAEIDSQRFERHVFLSYSSKDKKLANGLRRNLESKGIAVWYAPTTLEGGQIWRKRIEEGIQNASIFVALVTADYLKSAPCFGELMRFQRRIEDGSQRELLLLPLLCIPQQNVSDNPDFGPIFQDFQAIDLTTRFIDGLMLLVGRVQARMVDILKDIDSKQPSHAKGDIIPPSSSGKIA